MPAQNVYWISDGAGENVEDAGAIMMRWIRNLGNPALIVYGGDVYEHGTADEFEKFRMQMGGDLTLMCHTPGNHDWEIRQKTDATGRIPLCYEEFWRNHAPPLSAQPVDTSKKGGARYEHYVDLNGWRLIFLDTGRSTGDDPWPIRDEGRRDWLRDAVTSVPGRAKILFSHHSRLSRGMHGDKERVRKAWKSLFDDACNPLAACTLGGHDHNVSIYSPRPKDNTAQTLVDFSRGIYIIVNGAGGKGHHLPTTGTVPDILHDDANFCITRIKLLDDHHAEIEILSFGTNPDDESEPEVLPGGSLSIAL